MHTFHIPVMGLAFTIDSPVKVARFGISSVMSIIEDRLIEMMRGHYYRSLQEPYVPISSREDDYRARRITDYLNLVQRIVQQQVEKLRQAAFDKGSDIVRYFEMLPAHSPLKHLYGQMRSCGDGAARQALEAELRRRIQPGSIDVNIMTKTDRNTYDAQGAVIEHGSDAVAALRGYANSNLQGSSIVFSAGMNPRLFNYLEKCPQFDADEEGRFRKKIIIKVSDYRSALIQGKYLAKKGLWVSGFRIESGLNCGGHAFATDGLLMGPILEEFKTRRAELQAALFELYRPAAAARTGRQCHQPPVLEISAQGGIGSYEEDRLLRDYYGMDSTGWGTPFLLVPEATTVDADTRRQLCRAGEKDVVLSRHSPMGVPFHYLNGLSGEAERLRRIAAGKPGSPCTEKHLSFNTEFTEKPICTASMQYQRLKIAQLRQSGLPEAEYEQRLQEVLDKECLCTGLSQPAAGEYGLTLVKNQHGTTVCPGPNIAYFHRELSLQQMTDHIYGRSNAADPQRPHMFINELRLYLRYLGEQTAEDEKGRQQRRTFCHHLQQGIGYYRRLHHAGVLRDGRFGPMLDEAEQALQLLVNGAHPGAAAQA